MSLASIVNDGSFSTRHTPAAAYHCTATGHAGGKLIMTFRARDERGRDAATQAEEFRLTNEHYGFAVEITVMP